jgi:flagellar protein FlaJ
MLGYKGLATFLFGKVVDKNPEFFSFVKDSLPRADIKISTRTYTSIAFLTSVLVYFGALIFVLVLFNFFIKVAFIMSMIYTIFIPFTVATMSFVLIILYPYQRASSRRRNIETNLPFVLTHMGAVAASGIPPPVIFRLISQFKEYGEVAREMEKVVRNIDSFGVDPLTAIRDLAAKTPSDSLKQILMGFVTTTESGGDVKTFLKTAGDQALFEWRMKRERFLQQLSAYAEFYTGLLVAAPLFIISIFAVMNMIQPDLGGYSITRLMELSIYVIVPIVNIGFLIFLRGVEVEM